MSFVQKTWKNRNSANPIRRKLTRVDTGAETIYDVERYEGTVTEEGDDFSAENMNNLELRIKNAFDDAGGGNFVGVRYHASLAQFPDYPCWEDLTAAQKAKFDFSTGATVNFLDEDDSDNIIGTTDISDIADGTLTGAVDEHETEITTLKSSLTTDINALNDYTVLAQGSIGGSGEIALSDLVSNHLWIEFFISSGSSRVAPILVSSKELIAAGNNAVYSTSFYDGTLRNWAINYNPNTSKIVLTLLNNTDANFQGWGYQVRGIGKVLS